MEIGDKGEGRREEGQCRVMVVVSHLHHQLEEGLQQEELEIQRRSITAQQDKDDGK